MCRMLLPALVVGLLAVAPAYALRVMIVYFPPKLQAIHAEVVVAGKVVDLEKETAKVTIPGHKEPVEYTIANIKIEENLAGAKGITNIRVGFPLAGSQPNIGGIRRPIGGQQPVALTTDQEGVFSLRKKAGTDFYELLPNGKPLDKQMDPMSYATELEEIRKSLKIVSDPATALKAADAKDRRNAVSVLLKRYRENLMGDATGKEVPIDAEISKLLMKELAAMAEVKPNPQEQVNFQQLFNMLGVQQGTNGFNPPQPLPNKPFDGIAYTAYVVQWTKDHADTYRIQRRVVSKYVGDAEPNDR